MVRIELDSLEGSSGGFGRAYREGEFEFNDERVRLLDPPEISGRLARKGNRVFLTGRVVARVEVDCDRCLKSIEVPVRTEFSLQYVTSADYAAIQAAELDETDLALSVFDGEGFEIDEIVREQILLAVPTRALCREDCMGFCPVCGADRNLKNCDCHSEEIDPRWASLKELTNRKS